MCLYQQGDGSIPTGFKWLRISIWDIGVIEVSNKQSYIYSLSMTNVNYFSSWCIFEQRDHVETYRIFYQQQFPERINEVSPRFVVFQGPVFGLAVQLGPDGEGLVQTVHTPDHGVTSEQSFHNIQRRPLLGPSPC